MMGHMGTHGAAPALYPNLKYDPTKDFEPIGLAAGTPILIVAREDFPAADLKEFVAKAKDTSTRISQAHAGVGSVSITTCTLLTSQLGVKHHRVVAYRGTGPALNDMVGGQVDYMCDQIVNLVEQVRGGAVAWEGCMNLASNAAVVFSCPMHSGVRRSTPGKCPKCGMNLLPQGTRFGLLRHMISSPLHLALMAAAMVAVMAAAMMMLH
jgi:Tripartite tricarboxylate transporter family receptor/Heavy metal binding domain